MKAQDANLCGIKLRGASLECIASFVT